jgi:hypothetical protein
MLELDAINNNGGVKCDEEGPVVQWPCKLVVDNRWEEEAA